MLHETLIRGLHNSTILHTEHRRGEGGGLQGEADVCTMQKVLLVSIFTQVASLMPGNLPQHAGSAACKYVTGSCLIHPAAAGFGRIRDKNKKKIAAKCQCDIAERLQRQTCGCSAGHSEQDMKCTKAVVVLGDGGDRISHSHQLPPRQHQYTQY